MRIIVVGLSHKTAPVELREKLAFSKESYSSAFEILKANPLIRESIILSTCNRVEIYAVVDDETESVKELKKFLSEFHKVDLKDFESQLYTYPDPESITHLFNVASGIDSMVVGESEILGQLKDAYTIAHDNKAVGKILHVLFHKAFACAKDTRATTSVASGPVSVSSIAVELAEKIFGNLSKKAVMVLGAGETSELTAKHLMDHGVSSILVSNRSFDRAVELAKKFGGDAVRFDEFLNYLTSADIVISSTAAPHCIIKKDEIQSVMHKRKQRPLFLIDIAVPRDIEPEVNEIDNVYLYNIDDLKVIVDNNLKERQKEVVKCTHLITLWTNEFIQWLGSLEVVPAIRHLNTYVEEIRIRELSETISKLKSLREEERDEIEYLTKRIANQFLHVPLIKLKEIYKNKKDGYMYVEAIQELFAIKEEGKEER